MDFPWSPQFSLSRSENGHRGSVFIVNHLEGSKRRLLSLARPRRPLSRCRGSRAPEGSGSRLGHSAQRFACLPVVSICAHWRRELRNPRLLQGCAWLDGPAPLTAVTQVMFEFTWRFPPRTSAYIYQKMSVLIGRRAARLSTQVLSEIRISHVEHKAYSRI